MAERPKHPLVAGFEAWRDALPEEERGKPELYGRYLATQGLEEVLRINDIEGILASSIGRLRTTAGQLLEEGRVDEAVKLAGFSRQSVELLGMVRGIRERIPTEA